MSTAQQEIATPDRIDKPSHNVRLHQQITFGSTKWLTYTALFTALALLMKVIGQFGTLSEISKITPIYTIWLIAAAVTGPIGGAVVCFLSDIIIALVFPTGVINPFITIVCTLYGLSAGILFKYLPIKSYAVKFVIAGVTCALLYTFVLNSLAIWGWCKYYLKLGSFMGSGKNSIFGVYILTRLFQLGIAVANIPVAVAMIPLLKRIHALPPIKQNKKSKGETKPCLISL